MVDITEVKLGSIIEFKKPALSFCIYYFPALSLSTLQFGLRYGYFSYTNFGFNGFYTLFCSICTIDPSIDSYPLNPAKIFIFIVAQLLPHHDKLHSSRSHTCLYIAYLWIIFLGRLATA